MGLQFVHGIVISLALFGSVCSNSLPCDDNRCKTKSCNATGTCICDLPDPSTILEGDRPFLGGKFCNEEMVMCDGTNSFWCEHGGICEEIVQGENYTCRCPQGYTGDHCEHSGAPCGPLFCFHQAECLVEGHLCECPPQWKGSVDCSVATKQESDSDSDSFASKLSPGSNNHHSSRWVAVLVVLCSVGAIAGAVFYVTKIYSRREAGTAFQPMSQVQERAVEDDNEADSLVSSRLANSHA